MRGMRGRRRSARRERAPGHVSRSLRLVASAPARLAVAVAIIGLVMVWVGTRIHVEPVTIPEPSRDATGLARLTRVGDPLMVVFEADHLTPEYVSAVERITDLAAGIPGVTEVHSVTNTLVLTKSSTLTPLATPAFGTKSVLPLATTLTERAMLAATSRLGSADLISADGRTMAIIANLDPAITPDERTRAAQRFGQLMTTEITAAGLPATVHLAGPTFTSLAVTDDSRGDFYTLVALACIVPALISIVALRRRVPVAALLATGGAALLLASVLTANTAGIDTNPLDVDHPVSEGNRVVDRDLHGNVPLQIEFTGSPDDFRSPEILARIDALASWLSDEYGVTITGLSSTLRDETAILTGVDAVPPHRESVDALIDQTNGFDEGRLLGQLTNADYSRTRLVAYWPDHGEAALAKMANRFDIIATASLRGTKVAARLSGRLPATGTAPTEVANSLGALGALTIVLAAVFGLLGVWARHRVAVTEGLAVPFGESEDDAPQSLFGRAKVAMHELEQQVREYDDHDHGPADADGDADEEYEYVYEYEYEYEDDGDGDGDGEGLDDSDPASVVEGDARLGAAPEGAE